MKKLMIVAAIVCAAALANAAIVDWSTDYLYDSVGTMIGMHDGTEGLSYTAAITFTPTASASVSESWGQFTGSGSGFSDLSTYEASLVITELKNGAENATLTANGIFTTGEGTSLAKAIDFSPGNGFSSGSFFSNGDGYWEPVAVPEPFSGSLALLGMGVLALRRKMKKAKKA